MSRTRGRADKDRPEGDFYETPAWATLAVLPHLQSLLPDAASVLDPGAGRGAITRILRMGWPRATILAVEPNEEHWPMIREYAPQTVDGAPTTVLVGDFPSWAREQGEMDKVDLCVCNPPYSGPDGEDLALEFVQAARTVARVSAFLLRLHWLSGQDRYHAFMRDPLNRPHVMVLSKRPVFRGKHGDAAEYAWMLWVEPGLDAEGRFAPGTWRVLAPPPKDGR